MARLDRDILARVQEHIAAERLLRPGEPVLALISGGADSTLLLHALHELGYRVEALHVRHGLRGEESQADAEACAAACAALEVPLIAVDGPVADGPGLEARARDARRAAADTHAHGRTIATGHTRDDRVETILYRLASSPGRAALRALPPSDGGARVRPLLSLGREEIRAALRAAGIGWREDTSNEDRRFARNRIRHDLLPAFRSLHPAAEANLLETADALVAEQEATDAAAQALLDSFGRLDVARARSAPPALTRHALRLLAGLPTPPRQGIERALRLLTGGGGTRRAPLGGGREAERRYGTLEIVRGGQAAPPPAPVRPTVPGRTDFGRFAVLADVPAGLGLDPGLRPDLMLRAARPGDRVAGRRSTVARMLADAHVPAPLRSYYPVLEARGEVVCLPGVALSAAHERQGGIRFEVEAV